VSYLKLRRTRLILACFLVSSLLLWGFPAIDLAISRLFFHAGFFLKDQWWHQLIHQGMASFLSVSIAAVAGIYVFNRLTKRDFCGIDGKKLCCLFLIMLLGVGVIVNMTLKDNFGRARPRSVQEFGGSKRFTPAFVVSYECSRNCSFSSGEAAAGFFALALALVLSRKRAYWAMGVGFGSLVSFCRIASGAHFFSDTLVSFFVMLILTDLLYHYVVLSQAERHAPVGLLPGAVTPSAMPRPVAP
jgi:lipid A 4'-phosphatase